MKPLCLLLLLIYSQFLLGQTEAVYSFNQIGWTIKLPSDLNIVDSATRAQNLKAGEETVEGLLKQKINFSKTINLISAAKDKLNYFNSTLTESNSVTEENWLTADKSAKSIFYNAFAKLPNTKVDSSSAIQNINGVDFQKLQINININDKVLIHTNMLTTYYKGFYFGITYLYTDKRVGQEIDTMLLESRFDN